MLHKHTVSPDCLKLIEDLMKIDNLHQFRLAGGTALALQYGHRKSLDIDLFADKDFDNNSLLLSLESALFPEKPENIRSYPFGLFCNIRDIKTDFMYWGYPFTTSPVVYEGIRMAAPQEILAMKLNAIASRKEKKDYFDIALLLDSFSIETAISIFQEKYPDYDSSAIIKQLMYFDQADNTQDPEMLIPVTWGLVKEKIYSSVTAYWNAGLK